MNAKADFFTENTVENVRIACKNLYLFKYLNLNNLFVNLCYYC